VEIRQAVTQTDERGMVNESGGIDYLRRKRGLDPLRRS
jgi:hypothetical protein